MKRTISTALIVEDSPRTRFAANADGWMYAASQQDSPPTRTDGRMDVTPTQSHLNMSSNAHRAAIEHTTHPIPVETNDHRSDLVTRVLAYYLVTRMLANHIGAIVRAQGTMNYL